MQARESVEDDGLKAMRAAEARAKGKTNAKRLEELIAVFEKWLYLPDTNALKMVLASAAANIIDGDPLWTLMVGSPGCGKTEIVQPLAALPGFHAAGTLTEAALLSGSPNREKTSTSTGGLLRVLGEHGTIVLKDFGTILSMPTDKRATLLAALREVYDGSWTRGLGTDGGRTISWKGKCGLLSGCTPVIDSHHAVMSSLGERFLLYRMPVVDAALLARRSLVNGGTEKQMRGELEGGVAAWFRALDLPKERPALSDDEMDFLIPLATMVARARSSVERDRQNREIDLVPDPEAPGRLARQFSQLLAGAKVVGLDPQTTHDLIRKVGLDCIPALRRKALEIFATRPDGETIFTTTKIAEQLDHPTSTVRRALQDLNAHHLIERISGGQGNPDLWAINPVAAKEWEAIQ